MIPKHLEQNANWAIIREEYLSESPAPTYTELADRHGVSTMLISRMAGEEQWPQARLKRQQLALEKANAGQIIAEAISAEREVIDKAKSLAIKLLSAVELAIEQVAALADSEGKEKKMLDLANTASFCLLNTSNAMKALGVVGLPKALNDAGKSGNGQWDKQLLQQINVTVQGLTASETQRKVDIVETAPKVENVQVADTAVNS